MKWRRIMKFHLIAYALALAVLAGCASNAGGGGSASTSALLPAGGSPVSYQYTVEALDPLGGTLAGANSINNQNWERNIDADIRLVLPRSAVGERRRRDGPRHARRPKQRRRMAQQKRPRLDRGHL